MDNQHHGKRFFEENTILSVETVNIHQSKPKTTQDISLPSTHQFFNVFRASNGLTSVCMTATIKCTDNFCFKRSFSYAQHLLADYVQSVKEIFNIFRGNGRK